MSNSSGPWNKDQNVGPRAHFTPLQTCLIAEQLRANEATHDLCLFMVGIDTMLRCSDLLKLRIENVCEANGEVLDRFQVGQQKTNSGVALTLTSATRNACQTWISASRKQPEDYLFTRGKKDNERHINDDTYRKLVKSWALLIGLSPKSYSTHSLRRTKPHFMYRRGVMIEYISELLGHKNTATTFRYLGITKEEAQEQALSNDIFKKSFHRKTNRPIAPNKNTPKMQNFDVFLSDQAKILQRLDQLTTSNENFKTEIQAMRTESRALSAWIKDFLTNPSKLDSGKD